MRELNLLVGDVGTTLGGFKDDIRLLSSFGDTLVAMALALAQYEGF